MRRKSSFYNSGFTLIELLLSVAIFSIVSLTVYSVFFSAMKIQRHSMSYHDVVDQMHVALESLARDLENAVGYQFANSYPDLKAFEAEENRLTFVQSSSDGLRFVSYGLEITDEGKRHEIKVGDHADKNTAVTQGTSQAQETYQLIRKSQPFIDYVQGTDHQVETRIMCRNIKADGLKFFFGAVNPDSGERSWQSTWSLYRAPAMVKVSLTAVSSDQRTIELLKEVFNPSGTMIAR